MRRRCLSVTVLVASLVVLIGGCTAKRQASGGALPHPATGASSTPQAGWTSSPAARRTGLPAATRVSDHRPADTVTAGRAGAPAATLPSYRYAVRGIDAALAYRMRYSWRPGCPAPLSDLRYLRMSYYGFDGAAHTGELVVHAEQATAVVNVFRRLYTSRFPIYRMRLIDDYAGSDAKSMDADNTSAFNCRPTTGGASWSQHSYGRAIDINPLQNPYLAGDDVEPATGSAYLIRWPLRKGMIDPEARAAFAEVGWYWGGNWTSPTDYMHFSANNR